MSDHEHSFTYVYPAPADVSIRKGEYPYMICGCGLIKEIADSRHWKIEKGEWFFDDGQRDVV